MKKKLTIDLLIKSAKEFCELESIHKNKELYGITDGKAVGTFIEHKFQKFLEEKFQYKRGSSARGIDLPEKDISTDIKVTSIKQPQSSAGIFLSNKICNYIFLVRSIFNHFVYSIACCVISGSIHIYK